MRSNTAHDTYKLDGEVPEIIVWEDVQHTLFCEFECFKLVIFRDKTVQYLDDHFKLGIYLSPSKDIDPVIMTKITQRVSRSYIGPHTEH